MGDTDFVLLIRGIDAGATYLSYRWLDDPTHPVVHAVSEPRMRRLVAQLDSALIGTSDAQSGEMHVRQAFSGQLTRYWSEYALSEALTSALLPDPVVQAIREREARGPVLVRITPSRSMSRIPFELLIIDENRRLIEAAEVCYEPPATIHVARGRMPEAWSDLVAARPVLYAIDPAIPAGSGKQQVLPPHRGGVATAETNTTTFMHRVSCRPHTSTSGVHQPLGRWELRDDLLERPGRLVYFGHVSSTVDSPGSASLHLDDDGAVWGLATLVNRAHRPFSALDLLFGTAAPELGPEDAEAVELGRTGCELWPMPPRVALIACEGGVDYRSTETFGLVMAMLSAGAEVVTTTRWVVPSDRAFAELAGVTTVPGPTTELALAVDDTHSAPDPVTALAHWQRQKLAQWRDSPGPATTPLTWAAVAAHVCPPRPVVFPAEQ